MNETKIDLTEGFEAAANKIKSHFISDFSKKIGEGLVVKDGLIAGFLPFSINLQITNEDKGIMKITSE